MNPSIFAILLALGSILFLAYVTTKYIGKKSKKASRGNYIQVIETISLGMDKQLLLVKVAEQYVLISSSGKNIQFLTNINLDEYETQNSTENYNGVFDFKGLYDKYVLGFKDKKNNKFAEKDLSEDQFEPVEKDTIKSNLSRLRNITGLMNTKGKKDGVENTNEK
jgi:flagellar protein FliO/FliZ